MATTLPRPHSADFSSLGLSPALSPARARPKSQTFRSSPLAGPALSLTELATEKGKGSTTPPRVTVTLAELGAVRTTKGSVAFPHKHPEARRHSSVSFASSMFLLSFLRQSSSPVPKQRRPSAHPACPSRASRLRASRGPGRSRYSRPNSTGSPLARHLSFRVPRSIPRTSLCPSVPLVLAGPPLRRRLRKSGLLRETIPLRLHLPRQAHQVASRAAQV